MSNKLLVEDIQNIRLMVKTFAEKLKADHWKTVGYIKDSKKMKQFVDKNSAKEKAAEDLFHRIEVYFENQFTENKKAVEFTVADRILLLEMFSNHQEGLQAITKNLVGEECHFDVLDEITVEMKGNANSVLKAQMLIFSDI